MEDSILCMVSVSPSGDAVSAFKFDEQCTKLPPDAITLYDEICAFFESRFSHGRWIDTVPGWYNLNKEWYQFNTPVITSWGPCILKELSSNDRQCISSWLYYGHLLMIVNYLYPKVKMITLESYNKLVRDGIRKGLADRLYEYVVMERFTHEKILQMLLRGCVKNDDEFYMIWNNYVTEEFSYRDHC